MVRQKSMAAHPFRSGASGGGAHKVMQQIYPVLKQPRWHRILIDADGIHPAR